MLVKTNNNIQGVIAANDNIAGAVIADLKAKHLKPIPLSGQDASAQGVQYILAGWQTGTVYKYVPDEANAAAAAAVALLKGQKPKTNTFRKNGTRNEPTLALPVVWITKANYKRLFTDKFLKKSDVCIGDVREVLQVGSRAISGGGVLRGASTADFDPDERRHPTPRAPQHHQVVRLGAGAERRRLRGAGAAR